MNDAIEIDYPARFLGFNIPGMTPEESLEFFKKNFKKEYAKMAQEYTPYKGDELERANKSKQKALEKTKKTNGGSRSTQQNGTHLKMGSVEYAYYMAYNKGLSPILSDADANKNKQNPVQNEGEEDARVQINTEKKPEKDVVTNENAPMEQEQSLCICNKDDGKTMLLCDGCNIWYHLDCLGYSEEAANVVLKQGEDELWFHCDECRDEYFKNAEANKLKEN